MIAAAEFAVTCKRGAWNRALFDDVAGIAGYRIGDLPVQFHRSSGVPPMLHLLLLHPLDDSYDLAPTAAATLDIQNAAGFWNKALLDNAAQPSGAINEPP